MQRTFELSTHVKPVSRTTGRTATSAAAYRACCVIECEREARTHDFTRKRGLESTAVFLPPVRRVGRGTGRISGTRPS